MKIIKNYLEEGGNLLIIKGCQGDKNIIKNLNSLLNDYGVSFKGDYINNQTLKVNFGGENLFSGDEHENDFNILYPSGQSLNVELNNPKIRTLFIHGPIKQYLSAITYSKSGKGKLCVFGSIQFFGNDIIYKEQNIKIISKIFKYLLGININMDNIIDIINSTSLENNNWRNTYKMFSSLISKPKMTEKLLKRPPPKYIYDIIMNTMEKTGFPKGLFTAKEEDKKYFESDPHNKKAIINKVIDITKIVMNFQFDIKCSDILKGIEVEKTNFFLQLFYKAATTTKISAEEKNNLIMKYLDKINEKNYKPPKNLEEEDKQVKLAIEKSNEEMKLQMDIEKEEKRLIELALKESEKEYQINKINSMKEEINKKEDDDDEYDEFYGICPITQEYMEHPVLCPSGNYYEKSAIIEWIKKNNTDPLSREKLTVDMLIEDEEYKNKIIEFRKKFNK